MISQVALSLLLLVVAGLFLRSLQNLRGQELGFRAEGVLLVGIDPQGGGYAPEQLPGLYRDLVERLEALPGVDSASLSYFGLLTGTRWRTEASVAGYDPPGEEATEIEGTFVTPGYLETLGVPLLGGRELDETDREGAPKVAMVNETFARQYFGSESPLGRRFGTEGEESSQEIEIVGVVPDLKVHDLWSETPRLVYFPVAQSGEYLSSLQVHSRSELSAARVRDAVAAVAPDLPITSVRSLEEQVEHSLRAGAAPQPAHRVLRPARAPPRRRRVSTGSWPTGSPRGPTRSASGWPWARSRPGCSRRCSAPPCDGSGTGIVIGLVAALAASRFLSSLLFGLDPIDPVTLLLTTAVLVVVAALAAYGPARRASRLDPVRALRCE